jgi:hypothetical protein
MHCTSSGRFTIIVVLFVLLVVELGFCGDDVESMLNSVEQGNQSAIYDNITGGGPESIPTTKICTRMFLTFSGPD